MVETKVTPMSRAAPGCCDASRILLNVGVCNCCGRTCQRGQRSNALHEGRHPEYRGDHHAEEHQCGTGDGYEQNHRELIAARILAAVGGLHLPDGEYGHGDTDRHHQNTDYGSRKAGTTVVGQFNRTQCLQWQLSRWRNVRIPWMQAPSPTMPKRIGTTAACRRS